MPPPEKRKIYPIPSVWLASFQLVLFYLLAYVRDERTPTAEQEDPNRSAQAASARPNKVSGTRVKAVLRLLSQEAGFLVDPGVKVRTGGLGLGRGRDRDRGRGRECWGGGRGGEDCRCLFSHSSEHGTPRMTLKIVVFYDSIVRKQVYSGGQLNRSRH